MLLYGMDTVNFYVEYVINDIDATSTETEHDKGPASLYQGMGVKELMGKENREEYKDVFDVLVRSCQSYESLDF
jgi:hypothetical protein